MFRPLLLFFFLAICCICCPITFHSWLMDKLWINHMSKLCMLKEKCWKCSFCCCRSEQLSSCFLSLWIYREYLTVAFNPLNTAPWYFYNIHMKDLTMEHSWLTLNQQILGYRANQNESSTFSRKKHCLGCQWDFFCKIYKLCFFLPLNHR